MPGFLDEKLLFFASILLFFLNTAFSLPDDTPYHYAIISNTPIDKKVHGKPSNFYELLNIIYGDGSGTATKPGTLTKAQLKELSPFLMKPKKLPVSYQKLLEKSKYAGLPLFEPMNWPVMDPIGWSPIRPMRFPMFPSMVWADPLDIPFPKIPPIKTPQDFLLSFKVRPEDLKLNKFHFTTGHIVMGPRNSKKE